jgi:hypothetical protein
MELVDFLTQSIIAQKVKLPGNIVIHRASYSPGDIAGILAAGRYGPIPAGEEVCELEVNGIVIARGKIVQKRGEFFFKVSERHKEDEK